VRRRGRRLDLRRTIHRNVSHGGTLLDLAWRRRKIKPLRLVLLLDASGSMSMYTAFFVALPARRGRRLREAEAFVLTPRLAHVSASLRDRDVARAVDKLGLMAQASAAAPHRREPRHLQPLARAPRDQLAHRRDDRSMATTPASRKAREEMRRLRRRCRRIIWLNPLIGWRDYSPQARGMQAALPYIDLFAPAHNLASLAALEPYLRGF